MWMLTRFIICLLMLQACDNHRFQASRKSLTDPRLPPEGTAAVREKMVIAKNGYPENFKMDRETLLRGQGHFENNCSMCHGIDGAGRGFITTRGLRKPDSLFEGELLKASPEKIYGIITNGKGRMVSLARRLSPLERWETAAYVKALQLSKRMNVSDLTKADREKIK